MSLSKFIFELMAECLSMISVYHPPKFRKVLDGKQGFIQPGSRHMVPCGKCAFCLKSKRNSWMFRIYHEMRDQEHKGYFLTMTYDEKHVRRVGPDRKVLSLRFRDVQLYIKRLRKAKYYAKYICVGEYGGTTLRPHYHMLLWTDAPVEFLERNWKSSIDDSVMGSIHFGTLNMRSAMYTLKYIIQPKVVVDKEDPREPARAQFSRGLGLSYLDSRTYEWHTCDYDDPEMFSYIDGQKVAVPRYYRTKMFTRDQLQKVQHKTYWECIKKKRALMREALALGVKDTRAYFKGVRVEQARRIILTTKFNLTL